MNTSLESKVLNLIDLNNTSLPKELYYILSNNKTWFDSTYINSIIFLGISNLLDSEARLLNKYLRDNLKDIKVNNIMINEFIYNN